MTNLTPLRYSIASWAQAPKCLSNTSPDLRISVASIEDRFINAQIVSVEHTLYGTVFAAAVSGDGLIVSDHNIDGKAIQWLTTEQVLDQLARFGFYIEFNIRGSLPGSILSYLMTLDKLNYQHITRMKVTYPDGSSKIQVIAFEGSNNPRWLSYPCEITQGDLALACLRGTAINVSIITQGLFIPDDWSWLTFVANIKDVIEENK